MSTYVQNLLNGALGDGARATKFDINVVFPKDLFTDDQGLSVLAKAASFPGKSYDTIDFKYKGRSIPIKGQVKYEQRWDCTFYLTEDHKLKNAFEVWLESLDQKHNYILDIGVVPGLAAQQKKNYENYTTSIFLYQKNFDGDQDTAVYELYNVFPVQINSLPLSADSVGSILEFTVTFAYSYYNSFVLKEEGGNFIDTLVDKFKESASGLVNTAKNAFGDYLNDSVIVNQITSKSNEIKQFVSGPDDMEETIDNYI